MTSFQKHDSCPILMHVILTSLVHHWIQFSVFILYLFGSSAEMRWVEFLRLKGQAFELLRYEIPDLWSFLRKRQLVRSDRRWLMFGSAEKCLFMSPHQTGQFFLFPWVLKEKFSFCGLYWGKDFSYSGYLNSWMLLWPNCFIDKMYFFNLLQSTCLYRK